MKPENKSLRVGAAVVAGALALRLLGGSLPDKLISFFSDPEVVTAMMFLETGRVIRTPQISPTEPTQPVETIAPEAPAIPVFSAEDAGLVQINNASGCTVDEQALLTSVLDWDLTGSEPTVLILHTHSTESYTGSCSDPTTYRTQDENNNMLAVGQRLAERLETAGIGVIQDRTVHDYPSYNGSYTHARKSIKEYLAQYPSIRLVLDLHRDAVANSDGSQLAVRTTVDGESTAKLMMVVGTNAGGLNHPNWEENMALALKLHVQLEKAHSGICRPISLRSQRFNQDLTVGAMLIEVGAAGNTLDEALNAADLLAEAIVALSHGANL